MSFLLLGISTASCGLLLITNLVSVSKVSDDWPKERLTARLEEDLNEFHFANASDASDAVEVARRIVPFEKSQQTTIIFRLLIKRLHGNGNAKICTSIKLHRNFIAGQIVKVNDKGFQI